MTFTSDRTATAHVFWTCFLGGKCFVFPRSKKNRVFANWTKVAILTMKVFLSGNEIVQQQIATFDGIANPVPYQSSFSSCILFCPIWQYCVD